MQRALPLCSKAELHPTAGQSAGGDGDLWLWVTNAPQLASLFLGMVFGRCMVLFCFERLTLDLHQATEKGLNWMLTRPLAENSLSRKLQAVEARSQESRPDATPPRRVIRMGQVVAA